MIAQVKVSSYLSADFFLVTNILFILLSSVFPGSRKMPDIFWVYKFLFIKWMNEHNWDSARSRYNHVIK